MYTDPYFRMKVEGVFAIRNRGAVVTGQIESGVVHVDNEIYIHGKDFTKTAVVASIEMFRRKQQQAQAGDTVGLLLTGISKEDVQPDDVLLGTAR